MISAWNDYYGYPTPATRRSLGFAEAASKGEHLLVETRSEPGSRLGSWRGLRSADRQKPGSVSVGRHVEEVDLGPAARRGLVRPGGVARVPGGRTGGGRVGSGSGHAEQEMEPGRLAARAFLHCVNRSGPNQ